MKQVLGILGTILKEKKQLVKTTEKINQIFGFPSKFLSSSEVFLTTGSLYKKEEVKLYKVRGYLKMSRIVTLLLNLQLFPVKHAQFQLNGSLGNPHCDATTQDGNQNLKVNLTKKQKNINIFTYISRSH